MKNLWKYLNTLSKGHIPQKKRDVNLKVLPTELPCSIEEFGSGDKNSFPQ